MKIYNSKFKALGYEHVPEESDFGSDTYILHDLRIRKTINIKWNGENDDRWIAIHEIRRNKDTDQWFDVASPEITPGELDAINEFCTARKFGARLTWSEEDGLFKIS